MRRDMKLVRRLLEQAEALDMDGNGAAFRRVVWRRCDHRLNEAPDGECVGAFWESLLDGVEEHALFRHVCLLSEKGGPRWLLFTNEFAGSRRRYSWADAGGLEDGRPWLPEIRLTWAGHDALEKMRQEVNDEA